MFSKISIKRSFLLTVAAASLAICGHAIADPFVNITFDGDTVGQAPATSSSNTLPLTEPSAIGGYGDLTTNPYGDSPPTASDGTVLVGNPDGMNQAAVLTSNSANDQEGAVYVDTDYSGVTSQFEQVSFDLDVLNGPPAATIQPKILNGGPSTVGILFGVNDFQAGSSGFDFAAAPTSATGGVFGIRTADNTGLTSFFNYTDHTVYHIELDANYSTGLVDAYVNGVLEESGDPMQSGIVANANPTETFVYLNAEPGYANSVAIDNIQASVPEPASFGLLLVGGGNIDASPKASRMIEREMRLRFYLMID